MFLSRLGNVEDIDGVLMLQEKNLVTNLNEDSKDNSFQYGPICIDSRLRGTEAFPILFHEMRKEMSKRFRIGTTFINKQNERSYQAHIRKVKIDVINEFTFNNNHYYGLAFETGL